MQSAGFHYMIWQGSIAVQAAVCRVFKLGKQKKKKNADKDVMSIVVFMSIIAIALIIGGIFLIIRNSHFKERAVKVTGKIVEKNTERYWDSSDDEYRTRTTIYVSFELDGKQYDYVRLGENTKKGEGDRITLYVDKDDPSNISTSTKPVAGITLICMGVFVLCMTVPTIISILRKRGRAKNLLEQGVVISATVEAVDYDTSLTVNGKNPYQIICSYVDESTGKRYTFKSDSVWENINEVLNPGDLVRVYVQPNDYNQYHVDVETLLSKVPNVVDFT